jgi:hypothetical protein
MKFLVLLCTVFFAGNVFASNGAVTCSLAHEVNGKSTVGGEVVVANGESGVVEFGGYKLATVVNAVASPTDYEMLSSVSQGAVRLDITANYTDADSGKVFAGRLLTEKDSAVVTCTVN